MAPVLCQQMGVARMYVRAKVVKGATYYQLVEGYRDDTGRVRHRTLVSLGRHPTVADALKATDREVRRLRRALETERDLWPASSARSPRSVARLAVLERQVARVEERRQRLRGLLDPIVDDTTPWSDPPIVPPGVSATARVGRDRATLIGCGNGTVDVITTVRGEAAPHGMWPRPRSWRPCARAGSRYGEPSGPSRGPNPVVVDTTHARGCALAALQTSQREGQHQHHDGGDDGDQQDPADGAAGVTPHSRCRRRLMVRPPIPAPAASAMRFRIWATSQPIRRSYDLPLRPTSRVSIKGAGTERDSGVWDRECRR